MKKLLALVLALVMSMSLVTISNADFNDADKISNDEAVAVMNAVGVLAGYDNGDFGPTDTLTRAQACKILAYLDLGKDVAEALPSIKVFSDVPADNWAAKYIAYCADAGYVSGIGDGKFDPNANVTGYQFGKMVLCVLGYDATIEGMTGASWQIAVAKLMEENDIAKGVAKLGSLALTREEAAQYALNALKATCVEYEDKGTVIEGNGLTITTGAKKAENVTGKGNVAYTAISGEVYAAATEYTIELGEKLYKGDLKYTSGDNDDFGRPAHSWDYDKEDVVTSTDTAEVVFTAKTKAADVAKAMKGLYFENVGATAKQKIADSVLTGTFNTSANLTVVNTTGKQTAAAISLTNTAAYIAGLTANGKTVEVYTNSDGKITDIVTVEYTVAEVTKASTNAKGDETTYILKSNGSITLKTFTDENKDDQIFFTTAPEKGDIVTFAKISNTKYYVYPTTSFTGAQSAKNVSDTYVVINGTKYNVGVGVNDGSDAVAMGDFDNSDKTGNVYYVDQYGFVVKTTAASASTDYAYIVDVYAKINTTIDAKTPYIEVRAVLADGTVGVYEVAVEKKDGNWYLKDSDQIDMSDESFNSTWNTKLKGNIYGYTLDGKVMTLEKLSATLADDSTTLLKGQGSGDNDYYINEDDTSVLLPSSKTLLLEKDVTIVVYDDDDKVAKVYTGTGDLGTTQIVNFATVVSGKSGTLGTADIVFATVTGGLAADVSDYVYVTASDVTTTLVDGKTKYSYQGLMPDGSEITLVSSNEFDSDGLYKFAKDYTTKKENLIAENDRFKTDNDVVVTGNLVKVDGVYYNMENAQIVYVDDDLAEVNGNDVWVVLAKENGSVTKNVETIYVW